MDEVEWKNAYEANRKAAHAVLKNIVKKQDKTDEAADLVCSTVLAPLNHAERYIPDAMVILRYMGTKHAANCIYNLVTKTRNHAEKAIEELGEMKSDAAVPAIEKIVILMADQTLARLAISKLADINTDLSSSAIGRIARKRKGNALKQGFEVLSARGTPACAEAVKFVGLELNSQTLAALLTLTRFPPKLPGNTPDEAVTEAAVELAQSLLEPKRLIGFLQEANDEALAATTAQLREVDEAGLITHSGIPLETAFKNASEKFQDLKAQMGLIMTLSTAKPSRSP